MFVVVLPLLTAAAAVKAPSSSLLAPLIHSREKSDEKEAKWVTNQSHTPAATAMISRSRGAAAPQPLIKCKKCLRREAAIQCCGEALCLLHYYSSPHAASCANSSRKKSEVVVAPSEVLRAHADADNFDESWNRAFELTMKEVESVNREFMDKREADPLGAMIGFSSANASTFSSSTSIRRSKLIAATNPSSRSEDRKLAGNDGKRPAARAPLGSADSLASRKRRPSRQSYWSLGPQNKAQEGGTTSASSGDRGDSPKKSHSYGLLACSLCGSRETTFTSIGGDGGSSRKAEVWGSSNRDLMIQLSCHSCGMDSKCEL